MKQVVLRPGASSPSLEEAPEPTGSVLVRTVATGIDGTDEALVRDPGLVLPNGADRMVAGHEAAGLVESDESALPRGTLVVPLVRLGCDRCRACQSGRPDLCLTGDYVEAGIVGRDGFMREAWVAASDTLVPAPASLGWKAALAEPLSISLKALEETTAVLGRLPWSSKPRTLVCGSGSLASLVLLHLTANGTDCAALDRHDEDAPSSRFLERLGVKHLDSRGHLSNHADRFDVILETTGVGAVLHQALPMLAPTGSMALLGVPSKNHNPLPLEPIMRQLVLRNQVLLGSVNSSKHHIAAALQSLVKIEAALPGEIDRIVTCYRPVEIEGAYQDRSDVIKKVVLWKTAS